MYPGVGYVCSNSTCTDFLRENQVFIVPSGLLPLGLDADLCGCFLFEHVHRHMPDDRQVLVRIASPDPTAVLMEGHVQDPMQAVLDPPITVQTFDKPARMCFSPPPPPMPTTDAPSALLRVLCGWTIPVPVGATVSQASRERLGKCLAKSRRPAMKSP